MLRGGHFLGFIPPRVVPRRFLQTCPSLGPADKIINSRADALLPAVDVTEATEVSAFRKFRSWLKALYPSLPQVLSLKSVPLDPADKELLKRCVQYSKYLQRGARHLMKREVPPQEVFIKLLIATSEIRLLEIALKLIQSRRTLGAAPDDIITSWFLRAAVQTHLGGKEMNSDCVKNFISVVERGLGPETNGALIIGPQSVLNLLDAVTLIIPLRNPDEMYYIIEAVTRIVKTVYAGIERKYRERIDIETLTLLCQANNPCNYRKLDTPFESKLNFSYYTWIFERLQEVAKSCMENYPVFVPSPLHASVCECFLRRGSLPDWLIESAKDNDKALYVESYIACSQYLADRNKEKLQITIKELNLRSKELSNKHRLYLKESIKFLRNPDLLAANYNHCM